MVSVAGQRHKGQELIAKTVVPTALADHWVMLEYESVTHHQRASGLPWFVLGCLDDLPRSKFANDGETDGDKKLEPLLVSTPCNSTST
ncbi:hypothetical protein Tco_1017265 [Tanacetum coccineum]|uniref:NAC domain-containing protein n=1 Tax=Tanacetum coccineum TaxID=301880 RepID=A0ABQ5FR73_9ASTR